MPPSQPRPGSPPAPAVRRLSKSRFKEAWACPTRLYFTGKEQFGNAEADDPFLRALAEGGFQVGALAQAYHPGGILIDSQDTSQAVAQTAAHMAQDPVTLFEGALCAGPLMARADILQRRGDSLSVVEVKSKSFDPQSANFFRQRADAHGHRRLGAQMRDYIADVGFQALVAQRAYPLLRVTPYLMLVDRSARATVDGLNQKFWLRSGAGGRPEVEPVGDCSLAALGAPLLAMVDVSSEVAALDWEEGAGGSFAGMVDAWAAAYVADQMIDPDVGSKCRRCPYRIGPELLAAGRASGFEACWGQAMGLSADDSRSRPLVIDMARISSDALLAAGTLFLQDVEEAAINPQPDDRPGLSPSQRQWLQVGSLGAVRPAITLDREGLGEAMQSWAYPLHMIDFETMMPALPVHRGAHPYAQLAFQFSHHTLGEDGSVAHRSQWIASEAGVFPNFDFVRALRSAVGETGTIFRYHWHENTVLCHIAQQLRDASPAPDDAAELLAWLRTITCSPQKSLDTWHGPRAMVDMCELVKRFDHHPAAGGSNSLKVVLPAVLEGSLFLQEKYAQPIYGAAEGIPSHNFIDMAWVRRDAQGRLQDPYRLLQPWVGIGLPRPDDRLFADDDLHNGGAAMTALARMQFTQMAPQERGPAHRGSAALLRARHPRHGDGGRVLAGRDRHVLTGPLMLYGSACAISLGATSGVAGKPMMQNVSNSVRGPSPTADDAEALSAARPASITPSLQPSRPQAEAPPPADSAQIPTHAGALSALRAGRQALAQAADRPLGGLATPDISCRRLHRAEALVRPTPHAASEGLWRLPERLRLIDLTLCGAHRPDHQPSWQRAELDLLLSVGRCAQAHALWQGAAEDLVLLNKLITGANLCSVTESGLAPWVALRRRQMAPLEDAIEAARAHLEASIQRLSAASMAPKAADIAPI